MIFLKGRLEYILLFIPLSIHLFCSTRALVRWRTSLSFSYSNPQFRPLETNTLKEFKMSEEMAAPVSSAPPAATDHEFSSHQQEQPIHVPVHNTSRKSTLTKSMVDAQVTGTQTPMSGMRHSHFEPQGLEEYFVRSTTPFFFAFSWILRFDIGCLG